VNISGSQISEDEQSNDDSDHDKEFQPSSPSRKKRKVPKTDDKRFEKQVHNLNDDKAQKRRSRPNRRNRDYSDSSDDEEETSHFNSSEDEHPDRSSMDALVRDAELVVKSSEATQQFFETTKEDPVIVIEDDDQPQNEKIVTRIQYRHKPLIKVTQFKTQPLSDAFEVTCSFFQLDPSKFCLMDGGTEVRLSATAGEFARANGKIFKVVAKKSSHTYSTRSRRARDSPTPLVNLEGDQAPRTRTRTRSNIQQELEAPDVFATPENLRPRALDEFVTVRKTPLRNVTGTEEFRGSEVPSADLESTDQQAENAMDDNFVHLKMRAIDHPTKKYRMKKNDPLWKILNRFCEFVNMDLKKAKIIFDGDVVDPNVTPAELDLMDNDLLDVSEQR